ncbi:GGDEF domain-containing protein [Clostridium estertheticum]|uniref:tetratricopeptide repeat-containing diguanylate cyclase n=1 Tax=Clostridium estertheticum TaxID=238834 RepID=UPI0013E969BC|nr:GGDEF domain-containing protein [Clostridium estertheticum]MBZ9687152.1 GGDEF domain-containing protein [Clostridium estertheticum]
MLKEDLIELQRKISILRVEGKYKETIENCYELIESGEQVKDYKSILVGYMNLVASYYSIGDIEAAFSSLEIYKEICDKHGDGQDILFSYNSLFLLYEYNKDLDKAKNTLEKSIALGKELKKYNIVSNGYSNYSHICMMEEDYTKALEMANIGLEMAKLHRPSTPILELRVKLNIAKALIELKDFESSKSLIVEMINDSILDLFIREKANCYELQGYWYSKQQLYSQAFQSFSQAKEFVEISNDIYLLKSIQEERCKLCELLGDINSAYKIQKEYISLLNDISKTELAQAALKLEIKYRIDSMKKRANTDYLTGIYNRDYMETTANKFLKCAYKNNESIICIVFDIDNFKAINDHYGHLFGDEVIKKVSVACSSILREIDLFARFGGDEFVIILKGIALENGEKKAEQILKTVRNLNINKEGKKIPITISIGVTDNLTCAALYFNELFNVADLRLYRAKNSGRNRVCAVN